MWMMGDGWGGECIARCLSSYNSATASHTYDRGHTSSSSARADGNEKDCKSEEGREREWEDAEEEEEGVDVTPGSPTLSTLSSSSSVLSSDDFSFSPSYHLYPSDKYDYAGAATQLMEMMGREDGVAEALRWNGRVMREWSLDRVAALYLRVMEEQLIRRGKENGGRQGAMVTRASWYST